MTIATRLKPTAIGPVKELRRTVTAFSQGEPPACAKAGTAKVSMSAAILNVAAEVIIRFRFIRVALSRSIEFHKLAYYDGKSRAAENI